MEATTIVALAITALALAIYYISRHGVKTNVNVKYNVVENLKAGLNSALEWLRLKTK